MSNEKALKPSGYHIKKKGHLFSKAIFFESLKSNWKHILMVGGANALLMIIIVAILSTLNINATSTAMKNLFDSASLETTIKTGAISYYQVYDSSSEGYESVSSSLETLKSSVSSAISSVKDESQKSSMQTLRLAYGAAYRITSGDENAKKEAAYQTAVDLGNSAIETNTSLSSDEKALAKKVLVAYFSMYKEDTSLSHEAIMKEIMPKVVSETLASTMALSKDDEAKVLSILETAFKEYFDNGKSLDVASYEAAIEIAEIAVVYMGDATYSSLFYKVKEAYESDNERFASDASYRGDAISDSVVGFVIDTAKESGYYAYLPSFSVEYETSDLGWPISYLETGEKDSSGNPIIMEVEIKSYLPDNFVTKNGGLGTPATIVEKMHKEALTGEGYSEEEIKKAKEEALEAITTLESDLRSFMGEYTDRSNKNNPYYHDGARDKEAIEEKAISQVVVKAKEEYLAQYNEKYGTKYTDITAIDARESGMSGSAIVDAVYSYASSGVSSYKHAYKQKLEKGYTESESRLIATSIGGRGVMDQLPVDVNDSLTEMGSMNTYGIITGKIGFAIACLLIPMVYTVMLATSLISQKVENGSLAFTFSTPLTRDSFIFTEGAFLIFSQIVMGAILFLGSFLAREIGIAMGSPDIASSLPLDQFCYYIFGNFMVTLAVSAICFFLTSLFNKSGFSLGVSGGFVVLSFLCSILGLFGSSAIPGTVRISSMNFFNYLTIISFFDPLAVMNGEISVYWLKLIGLAAIIFLGYIASGIVFKKKDLPL